MVDEGCPTACERLAIDGRTRRGALLPPPQEHTDPLEHQHAHGGSVGVALVAWLLVIDLCPAGVARGFCCPCHARLAEERRTWQAPVDPGLLAAACGHRRDASVF